MKYTLREGDEIPDVSLKDQDGHIINLRDFIGKKALVVFFYPKDDTPICTTEACGFRDKLQQFHDAGAEVIGISSDTVSSHKTFKSKYQLNYRLLSDGSHVAEKAFGVPRNLLGLLPGRVTYVFDRKGHLISSCNSSSHAIKHIHEAMRALDMPDEIRKTG